MRHSVSTAPRAFALAIGLGSLAAAVVAAPASAVFGPPAPQSCPIRFAEAKVCPAFHLVPPADGEWVWEVSGDGSTLVGAVLDPEVTASGSPRTIPVRWVDGKLEELEVGIGPGVNGFATAVSRDGSVIAGTLWSETPSHSFVEEIFLWRDGVVEIRPSIVGSHPNDMSGDGKILSGDVDGEGWRWHWAERSDPEYWRNSRGLPIYTTGISDAGDIIVGLDMAAVTGPIDPWVWIGATSETLPVPAPNLHSSGAYGISPDGSVIVGTYGFLDSTGALWREGVFEPLAFRAADASFDGLFLVGPLHFWNATGEAIELAELFAGLGVEMPGLHPGYIKMSNDGHVLVGRGYTTGHDFVTWTATVSPKLGIDVVPGFPLHLNRINLSSRQPVVVRVFGSAQADAAGIEPEDLFFGPARAHPIDARPPQDHNQDGHPDRDFLFDVTESGLAVGDREVCLAGVASELPFRLCSRAHPFVTGCGPGAELALVVPLAIVVRRGSRRLRARA